MRITTGAGALAVAAGSAVLLAACGARAGGTVTAAPGRTAAAVPGAAEGDGSARSAALDRGQQYDGGGAIFFVSNDRTGTLLIKKSALHGNPSDGFFTAGYPGIFFLGRGTPVVTASTIS